MTKPIKVRADIITKRTYCRPLDNEGNQFESWADVCGRVVYTHQKWLWERVLGRELEAEEMSELNQLYFLMLDKKVSMSGRTLWLGGTNVARTREASQFNCSFLNTETVYDIVDSLWLLLQGCGVGFMPVRGTLNGFFRPIKNISVIRSKRSGKGGTVVNEEEWDSTNLIWTIRVGDSAESWAKSIGKLLAGKYPANKLVLDFSNIRPAGERLKGYGWISSGDDAITKAYVAIAHMMNRRAGSLLRAIDILDLVNWLGTILSSRRSAEIALLSSDDPEWKEFATAKKNFWEVENVIDYYEDGIYKKVTVDNSHRCQSNNSLVFYSKPSREKLQEIFRIMEESGGSEPGFINGVAALKRAPWFKGVNPCAI